MDEITDEMRAEKLLAMRSTVEYRAGRLEEAEAVLLDLQALVADRSAMGDSYALVNRLVESLTARREAL